MIQTITALIVLISIIVFLYLFLNKKQAFSKKTLSFLFLALFSVIVFSETLQNIILQGKIYSFDLFVNSNIYQLQSNFLTKLMVFFTSIANFNILIFLVLAVLVILIIKKRYFNSIILIITLGLGFLCEIIIKHIIQRARPSASLITETGFSFPSGHAISSIIFFGFLIYLFKNEFRKTGRYWYVAICLVLAAVISFSRIYLQVHWFSDVLAGFAVGLFWLSISLLISFKLSK